MDNDPERFFPPCLLIFLCKHDIPRAKFVSLIAIKVHEVFQLQHFDSNDHRRAPPPPTANTERGTAKKSLDPRTAYMFLCPLDKRHKAAPLPPTPLLMSKQKHSRQKSNYQRTKGQIHSSNHNQSPYIRQKLLRSLRFLRFGPTKTANQSSRGKTTGIAGRGGGGGGHQVTELLFYKLNTLFSCMSLVSNAFSR